MIIAALLSLSALAAPPAVDVLPHREAPPHTLEHAALYPLGFSPDGKLATLQILPDQAVGCFLWSVSIVSLVDDSVVAEEHWDEGSCEAVSDLETLWAARGAGFERLMAAHGVRPGAVPLRPLPLPSLMAWLVPQAPGPLPGAGEDSFRVPMAVRVRGAAGEKTVGHVDVTQRDGLPMSWGYEIVGALQSPYEDRVALVIRGVQRGWEGPPNVETVHIIGASLSSGF